ncbi:MAG: Smr/MutS family protein [Balneola sp.]|nr:Smr/MutS family protein [Balneola sp.]MBO6651821.1 Smr/MutS family protein [Balneola sp.]MBO6710768.1 Smr/MutS family protein [Balneola sp.]MBO6799455.1 Smr/MutS family protein [Balneola sp.]MBO6870187.1 Smr/MutS family protein [Balneola sp.]
MTRMEPVELPIDGILDLHLFSPKELGDLIPDYIEACLEKGIYSIRIIHGKGKGVLRRTVHSLLDKNEFVVSYRLADDRSSWGATLVELKNS